LAKNIYTKEFHSVQENDPLSRCIEAFKNELPPVLAVVDEKNKYVGVISRRWILRSRPRPKGHQSEKFNAARAKINP
jgi:predicted transcriptional regulator